MRGRWWWPWLLGAVLVALTVLALMIGGSLIEAPAEVDAAVGLMALVLSVLTYVALYVVVRRARW